MHFDGKPKHLTPLIKFSPDSHKKLSLVHLGGERPANNSEAWIDAGSVRDSLQIIPKHGFVEKAEKLSLDDWKVIKTLPNDLKYIRNTYHATQTGPHTVLGTVSAEGLYRERLCPLSD